MLFKAFQDLLGEKTFDQISVQDLAERSTLNRATFYDHFTDKFALLEAMIGERFSTLIEARMAGSEPTCEAALKQLILATCDFLAETSSGCQKHQRQFEPFVESSVKTILCEVLRKDCASTSKVPRTQSHHGELGHHRRGSAMERGSESLFRTPC